MSGSWIYGGSSITANVFRLGVCYFALQILQALDKFNSAKPLLVAGVINPWKSGDTVDIWGIDTNKLNNDWFVDLNYVDEKDNKHIMTFQPIPPKYLEIAKKGIKK